MEPGDTIDLPGVVIEMEMEGAIFNLPSGPCEGYRFRFLLNCPPMNGRPAEERWSERMFVSQPNLREMLQVWKQYLAGDGNASHQIPPGAPVQ